jgi:hypothetical protein
MGIQKRTLKFQKGEIDRLLPQCTQKEQDFFHRIFPKGVPEDKLISAIQLIERTLDSN